MESSDLKKAGLKITLPRMKILELLESSEVRHQSAEDIYRALLDDGEEIGLATVYRVLTQFETAGLVERHHFEGGQAVFELNEKGHHDHIVCVICGKVEEFYDELIEARQDKVAAEKNYEITDHSLTLYGKCSDCRES
ncbi:MAG: ferric iron uptake transcriptional regulator [Gammaproteobacteria bacterium]|nr:MAG: ferric iron uptake transcriptional regulator [Gammaproteobacteria bacterium]